MQACDCLKQTSCGVSNRKTQCSLRHGRTFLWFSMKGGCHHTRHVPSSTPPPRPPHSLPRQRGKHRRAFAFAFAILPQRQTDRKRNARPNTKLNARPAVARPVIAVAIDQSKRSQSLTSLHVRRAYTQRAYTSLTSRNGHQGPEHMETPRLNTESPRLPCVEPPGDSRVGSVFAISAGQGGRRRTRMPR